MRYLVILALTGCNILGPDIEHWSQRPLVPVPAAFADLYAAVEVCWGKRGDFGAVNWFVADKITVDGTGRARGTTRGDDITIARDYLDVARTIKHEASHHVSGRGNDIHYKGASRAICDDA